MTRVDKRFEPSGFRARRLIALEFNELCPTLLDRWMDAGVLPNFSRLRSQSEVFVTSPDVTDPALLEPWIQWYSIHTGLGYDQHRVFHLTDGARAGHADIYRLLLAADRRVASFASMNVPAFAAEGSVFVADPWSEDGNAHPAELDIYNRFVSFNVREYSNARMAMSAGDYAKFLAFMASHGLQSGTVAQILGQLAGERTKDRRLSWRRVALLDRMQFDVFRHYYRRHRPDFASFFVNSVAHLQHSYWRHMEPAAFTVRPDAGEMAVYGDAVRFGYQAIDRLLGRFLKLAEDEGAALMFVTALSQQPFLRHEELGGQHFHRLHHVESFLKQVGIDHIDVAPTMTHQYMLTLASAAARDAARARLDALRLEDGRRVFDYPAVHSSETSLYFGCQLATRTAADTPVIDETSNRQLRFGDLFYQIDAIKSGRHHPDGCLWIQTGAHREHAFRPSILDILPTQLDMLGVPTPAGELRGTSLSAQLAG